MLNRHFSDKLAASLTFAALTLAYLLISEADAQTKPPKSPAVDSAQIRAAIRFVNTASCSLATSSNKIEKNDNIVNSMRWAFLAVNDDATLTINTENYDGTTWSTNAGVIHQFGEGWRFITQANAGDLEYPPAITGPFKEGSSAYFTLQFTCRADRQCFRVAVRRTKTSDEKTTDYPFNNAGPSYESKVDLACTETNVKQVVVALTDIIRGKGGTQRPKESPTKKY